MLDFNDWLKQEAEAHDRVKVISFKRKEESSEKVKTSSKSFAATAEPTSTNDSSRTPEPCIVCKARHALWRCAVFREKTPTQRAKLVAENRLCFSCLNGKHTFRKCPKSRKCGKDGCKSSHNTLLHGAERVFPATDKIQKLNQSSGSSNSPKPAASAAQDTAKQTSKLTSLTDVKGLLQVKLIDVVTPSGKSARALSLCDTGGSHSWMSHSLAERLDVAGTDIRLIVNGINTQKTVDTSMVTVTIHPLGDKTCDPFELSPYLSANLNVGSDTIDVPSLQEVYPHLSVLDPVNYSYAQVEIILGQDVYHAIRPIEYFEAESKHSKHSPVAVRIPIGWVLSGPLPSTSTFASTCFKAVIDTEPSLADQIKSWYDLESFGAAKKADPRSAADRRALAILENTTVHENGRYQVGMLWASEDLELPNNYFPALLQMKSLEKRLDKDPSLKQKYAESIRIDLEKGYVVKVLDPDSSSSKPKREWYLPHHPVFHPLKPEKVRRVLNGAAKFHGWSLNKALLTGPDLLQRLLYTLLRFRQHRYAVSADIEGIILQVGVPLSDQPSLRFLWREDPAQKVAVYQYTRHIFGAKDSPTCANYALQRTATDNQLRYPDAARAVYENFYMDDYLDPAETREEAISRSQRLAEMLKLGGFKLTKFVSNDDSLVSDLREQPTPDSKLLCASSSGASSHVLGLKWDHLEDTLVVSRGTQFDSAQIISHRVVLSVVSKVFDPIGLVTPFTISARLLLKEIWRIKGQQWDDPLPKPISDKFLAWSADLPALSLLTIPRGFFTGPFDMLELHVFGDGSQEVFSAVAFLRAKVCRDGKKGGTSTELAFVLGKARVAPMKVLTVPKLELQAALLAARLRVENSKALKVRIAQTFMWTDSTTVLQWLNSTEKQPIFVANRVTEILESTSVDQWHHVASSDNPADAGTRGMSALSLKSSSWLVGPAFLKGPEFPFRPPCSRRLKIEENSSVLDETPCLPSNTASGRYSCAIRFERFSSYPKLLRVAAYVLRVLPKFSATRSSSSSITAEELVQAEEKVLFLSQYISFLYEIQLLRAEKPLPKTSRISRFFAISSGQ